MIGFPTCCNFIFITTRNHYVISEDLRDIINLNAKISQKRSFDI